MFLNRLELTHFRNYRSLQYDFDTPFTLVQGQNAQGKSTLLEAIYYLATSKSTHARLEREVVGWSAEEEPIPFSRIRGEVRSGGALSTLEILFSARSDGSGYTKQIRINGVGRRSIDLIGILRAVLFLPEDVVLVSGSPGERRRYLDVALCQIDRVYCQHLSRYQKVITQRNSLLRQLREEGARPGDSRVEDRLNFWDEQLVDHGAAVLHRRLRFVAQLESIAKERHAALSAGRESLQLAYFPSFNPGHVDEVLYRQLASADVAPDPERLTALPEPLDLGARFRRRLRERRSREIAAAATLYGPHRDDLLFWVDRRNLRSYGSRGQQRTGALALKLAEVEAMRIESGEAPLLLLDDVMSELDGERRSTLLSALDGVEQAVITTTDWEDFSSIFRRRAERIHVVSGRLSQVEAEVEEGVNDEG